MVGLLVLSLAGCKGDPRRRVSIVVAGADTPEQRLLTQMTVQYLRAKGYRVEDKTALGEPWAVRSALVAGNVDISWEYTADTWLVQMAHDQPLVNAQLLWDKIREEDARRQISWVAMADVQRSLCLVVRSDTAEARKWRTIADLVDYARWTNPRVRLCVPKERYATSSGIQGLERLYQFRFPQDLVRYTSIEEGYQALTDGQCDCALGFTTDIPLHAPTLRMLQDGRSFFPASYLAVAIRTPLLEQFPELEDLLSTLAGSLDQQTMADMQRQLIEDKPATVAKRFLGAHDLLGSKRAKQQETPAAP